MPIKNKITIELTNEEQTKWDQLIDCVLFRYRNPFTNLQSLLHLSLSITGEKLRYISRSFYLLRVLNCLFISSQNKEMKRNIAMKSCLKLRSHLAEVEKTL